MDYLVEVSERKTLIWDKMIREELIIYISLVWKRCGEYGNHGQD